MQDRRLQNRNGGQIPDKVLKPKYQAVNPGWRESWPCLWERLPAAILEAGGLSHNYQPQRPRGEAQRRDWACYEAIRACPS